MKNQQNKPENQVNEELQNKTDNRQTKGGVPAQEDGFRYDYDDSSDLK